MSNCFIAIRSQLVATNLSEQVHAIGVCIHKS